ncbi:MAG: hypothetical protein WBV96_02765, partial [Polyangia bacterium]
LSKHLCLWKHVRTSGYSVDYPCACGAKKCPRRAAKYETKSRTTSDWHCHMDRVVGLGIRSTHWSALAHASTGSS